MKFYMPLTVFNAVTQNRKHSNSRRASKRVWEKSAPPNNKGFEPIALHVAERCLNLTMQLYFNTHDWKSAQEGSGLIISESHSILKTQLWIMKAKS